MKRAALLALLASLVLATPARAEVCGGEETACKQRISLKQFGIWRPGTLDAGYVVKVRRAGQGGQPILRLAGDPHAGCSSAGTRAVDVFVCGGRLEVVTYRSSGSVTVAIDETPNG